MKKIVTQLLVLFPIFAFSQNVGIGTTNPLARLHVTDSNVIFTAAAVLTSPVGFTVPVSGAGTRMMWLAKKSAFRAGTAAGNQWDADSIGTWSFGTGRSVKAVGEYSFASGFASIARGHNSIAMGDQSWALDSGDVAMGSASTARGKYSTAIGSSNEATNLSATAIGNGNRAIGEGATAVGIGSEASGDYSLALGFGNLASGFSATTTGWNTRATGDISASMGFGTIAKAYNSVAIGRFNDSVGSSLATNWVSTDPLFYVGNGSADNSRHNAMVLYKNGIMVLKNPTAVTTDPGVLNIPISGAGTRLMWLPEKSAFRAGTVSNISWNADSIGTWSFATGFNNIAKGAYSFAAGSTNTSSGNASAVFGTFNYASGNSSFTGGSGNEARGTGSTAFGLTNYSSGTGSFVTGNVDSATGSFSTAMGFNNMASGPYAIALGNQTKSTGNASFSTGFSTQARGLWSLATGNNTMATGSMSQAHGLFTYAKSSNAVAFGRYNDSVVSSDNTLWVNTDPLFILGNGTADNSRHNAMVVYKNGNMVLKNPTEVTTDPLGFIASVSGAGTRLMWLPEKSAFRVGTVNGSQWDAVNIGPWSFASGRLTTASGINSTAMGYGTTASGLYSTAFGWGTVASGLYSTATGDGATASGAHSTTMGGSTIAIGDYSTAMGNSTIAYSLSSTSMGGSTQAIGEVSTAMGNNTIAMGTYSTAMGSSSIASGDGSTAMGLAITSRAYGSLAMGRYNDSINSSNKTTWVTTDPLLIIGNGTSDLARSNAIVVYKNGNTDINGYTQLGEIAPAIKMKKLTGTSAATQGTVVTIPHGLTRSKIIGVQVLLNYAAAGGDIPASYLDVAGYEYNWQVTNTDINIYNKAGNSINILSKPVRILITYEE